MRSHSSTSPPLPPVLHDLAAMLPLPNRVHHSRDDSDIPMGLLDHDTSRLIRPRKRKHRVWVQGVLAPVRSVSTVNLPATRTLDAEMPPLPSLPKDGRRNRRPGHTQVDRGVSGSVRRRSLDDDCSSEEEDERETVLRDTQLRGYGIGGAGNIRRPIDVIHGPTRSPGLHRAKKGILVVPIEADKQRFSLREFISRKSDKKGKMREQLIRADVEA